MSCSWTGVDSIGRTALSMSNARHVYAVFSVQLETWTFKLSFVSGIHVVSDNEVTIVIAFSAFLQAYASIREQEMTVSYS